MLPLEGKGIPIIIKNTFNREAKGTEICKIPNGSAFAVAESDGYFYAKIKQNGKFLSDKIFTPEITPVFVAFTADYAECVLSGNRNCFFECNYGYFENSVTLFYATACLRSRAFFNIISERKLCLFEFKNSDGYYAAVKTVDKKEIELILTDFLKS